MKELDKTSMLYWFPKVIELVPVPLTYIFKTKADITEVLQKTDADSLSDKGIEHYCDMPKIKEACKELGYPVFMRSDMTSNKHRWKRTCFVESEKDIIPHLKELMVFSQLADIFTGIPFNAVVIREYIPMHNLFLAFDGMPVNPEWRLFAKDGKVLCEHWYWIQDAIEGHTDKEDYPALLSESKSQTSPMLKLLREYSEKVSLALPGQEWSIDFCMAKDGRWLLIDMAIAEKSWHDPHCERLRR